MTSNLTLESTEFGSTTVAPLRLRAADFVGVYLVLLLLIPSRLIIAPLGAVGTPSTLWGLLGGLWWLCASIGDMRPAAATRRSPVKIALGLLVVAVTLSYAAGMTKGWYAPVDVRGATDDVYDLVPSTVADIRSVMLNAANRGMISAAVWMGMAMLIVDGLRSAADLDRLVRWLTTIGAILGTIGVLQFFTGVSIEGWFRIPGLTASEAFGAVDTRSVVRRVYVTAKHPIEYGVLLGAIFPFALHRAIHSARSWVAYYSAAITGLAVTMSISRSGILVVGVSMFVMFCGWPAAWRIRFLLTLPFALIGVRLLAPGVVGTLRSLFGSAGEDPSVAGRTEDYDVAFRVMGENPIFGRGLFTFVPRYYRILDNQLLMMALEIGIVGLAAFVGVVVVSIGSAVVARRRFDDPSMRHLCLALAASTTGLTVSYATFDTWGFPMAAGVSFVLFGACGAALRLSQTGSSITPDRSSS